MPLHELKVLATERVPQWAVENISIYVIQFMLLHCADIRTEKSWTCALTAFILQLDYEMDDRWTGGSIPGREEKCSHGAQTCFGAQPASHITGTWGSLSGDKATWTWSQSKTSIQCLDYACVDASYIFTVGCSIGAAITPSLSLSRIISFCGTHMKNRRGRKRPVVCSSLLRSSPTQHLLCKIYILPHR